MTGGVRALMWGDNQRSQFSPDQPAVLRQNPCGGARRVFTLLKTSPEATYPRQRCRSPVRRSHRRDCRKAVARRSREPGDPWDVLADGLGRVMYSCRAMRTKVVRRLVGLEFVLRRRRGAGRGPCSVRPTAPVSDRQGTSRVDWRTSAACGPPMRRARVRHCSKPGTQ